MLGGLALVAMLAGVLAAACAIFDWEFLFSDGRRPREWTASMGRAAARTLIGLAGGALLAGGFVSRVIAVANTPVEVAPRGDDPAATPSSRNGISPGQAVSAMQAETARPADGRKPRERPAPDGVARRTTGSGATARVPAPPPPASAAQVITLWNPTAAVEPGGTILFTIEYRFEAGQRPRADEQYWWIIDLADKTRAVEYFGDALQKQGQLRHLVQTHAELADRLGAWTTTIRMGPDETGRQISNQLTIDGNSVESAPP